MVLGQWLLHGGPRVLCLEPPWSPKTDFQLDIPVVVSESIVLYIYSPVYTCIMMLSGNFKRPNSTTNVYPGSMRTANDRLIISYRTPLQ